MTMSFGSKPTVLKELCSLSQTISMSIMSLDLWKKENAAFPVKIKSMSLRKAILSFSTLGTIIPASNSVLSAGSVEGMCQKLPGHVQDFHLRERAHGAQTKRPPGKPGGSFYDDRIIIQQRKHPAVSEPHR